MRDLNVSIELSVDLPLTPGQFRQTSLPDLPQAHFHLEAFGQIHSFRRL